MSKIFSKDRGSNSLCSLFSYAINNSDYIQFNDWMIGNNELEMMWKEAVVTFFNFSGVGWNWTITVAASSNAGIVGSNPTRGTDVCVRLFCVCVVLCVGSCLATGWSPSKESYRLCIGLRYWKSCQGPTKGCRSTEKWENVRLSPFGMSATNLPIAPAPDDRYYGDSQYNTDISSCLS
jgi:hypothetical protein